MSEREQRRNLAELDGELRRRLLALDEPVSRADWYDVGRRGRGARTWVRRLPPVGGTLAAAAAVTVLLLGGWSPLRHAGAPGPDTATLRRGSHLLYVTASRAGGFCYRWSGVSDGCDRLTSAPLSSEWTSHQVVGTVSRRISAIRIEFTDGTHATARISWVSSPVDACFFLFAIPPGKTVAAVSGFSDHRLARRVTWFSV
jgi:hypothetical protein